MGAGGWGRTLSEVYQSAKKLLLRTRDALERLERVEYSTSTGMDSELAFAIKEDITQIQSLCVEMDRLWRSIAAKSQGDLWKRIFDEEAQAMQSVRSSKRELENANEFGEAIHSSIHGQRERLKSAQRKALDVLSTAGISNAVLRLIERRHRVDQWIKYAGMLLTVVFLLSLVLWRH